MKRLTAKTKKVIFTLVSVILSLSIVTGATYAILYSNGGTLRNIFSPADVTSDVLENTDGSISVQNTGSAKAYLRCAISVNWVLTDESGAATGSIYGKVPLTSSDYSIAISSDWTLGVDGFYYYSYPTAPGETVPFVTNAECLTTPPESCSMSVEVVASAIQSDPKSVVLTYWDEGAVIDENGKLTPSTE